MEAVIVLERAQSTSELAKVNEVTVENVAVKRKRMVEDDEEERSYTREETRAIGDDLMVIINQEKEKNRLTVGTASSILEIKRRYEDIIEELNARVAKTEGKLEEAREQLAAFR